MTTKIVCRLMGGQGKMLGWAVHQGTLKGDGMIRTTSPISITCVEEGKVDYISLHWCDVHVEVQILFDREVKKGEVLDLFPIDHPLIKAGNVPGPLPAITVGSTKISLPVGGVGVKGQL